MTRPLGIDRRKFLGSAAAAAVVSAAGQAAPGRLNFAGIDHYAWLNDDYFSRNALGTTGTLSANHTWAGWADVFSTYGPMSTPSLHYSEYFIELIKAFRTDLNRQVACTPTTAGSSRSVPRSPTSPVDTTSTRRNRSTATPRSSCPTTSYRGRRSSSRT